MKKYLFALGIIGLLFSCNKNDDVILPTQSSQEGQEIELTVSVNSDNNPNLRGRTIQGYFIADVSSLVTFKWSFSDELNDVIYLENVSDTKHENMLTFTMKEFTKKTNTATFTGTIPDGWQKEDIRVISGSLLDNPPTETDIDLTGGVKNNYMRFEDTISSISDKIELSAIWSTFRLPIRFNPQPAADLAGYTLKYYVSQVIISANYENSPSTTTYTYNLDLESDFNVTGADEKTKYLLFIVKPGKYSNLQFDVTFDLTKCGSNDWKPTELKEGTKTFSFKSNADITIPKNWCYETAEASCRIDFE